MKWKLPSLERFIYDFLEKVIARDLSILGGMERELNALEETILNGEQEEFPPRLKQIRSSLMALRVHYEQLIDLGQELLQHAGADIPLRILRRDRGQYPDRRGERHLVQVEKMAVILRGA